jgi:hypothetical protein
VFSVTLRSLNGFSAPVNLSVNGLPAGVTASMSFQSVNVSGSSPSSSALSVVTTAGASPGVFSLTLTGTWGAVTHTTTLQLTVMEPPKIGVQVPLASTYNRIGIVNDGRTFTGGGIDGDGFAYSANQLGGTLISGGTTFTLGPPNGSNAVSSATIRLSPGKYSVLKILATGVNGNQAWQPFVVAYSDGTTSVYSQNISNWSSPQGYSGEQVAAQTSYRDVWSGTKNSGAFYLYLYSFALNPAKTVASLTLPNNKNVVLLAIGYSSPVMLNLSSVANITGSATDDVPFSGGGLDTWGGAYSRALLSAVQSWNGVPVQFGPTGGQNAVTKVSIPVAAGQYSGLTILGTGCNGAQTSQVFSVKYADGTSNSFTQSLSDWFAPAGFSGESVAAAMPYRDLSSGNKDPRTFNLYGYQFPLDRSKTLESVSLPANGNVVVLAVTVTP